MQTRYFNPLPRKEGDSTSFIMFAMSVISIHSLVKRETVLIAVIEAKETISIHSLVKRET